MTFSEYAHKRRVILCIVLLLPMLTGCIDVFGQRRLKRDRLLEERDRLYTELTKNAPLFDERDRLRQELIQLRNQEEQLFYLQKAWEREKK